MNDTDTNEHTLNVSLRSENINFSFTHSHERTLNLSLQGELSSNGTSPVKQTVNTDGNNNSLNGSIDIESDPEKSGVTGNADKNIKPKEIIKRKTNVWSNIAIYTTYTEEHNALVSNGFRKHVSKVGKDGRITNYHCNKVKQKSKVHCAAGRRIFRNAMNTNFELQSNQLLHPISEQMKKVIVDCVAGRMTVKYIAEHIDSLRKNNGL